ncbi:hypothetical protein BDN72DRAFT_126825 [Pluteus cervinus]|uniref:Uncharacterized protein n=1 Tax=Pluteus cervinus TaxID=181527 RepID=A0ACD3AM95_9AGAR|nr:hypothetical protein BDN72DRAFT_126825 [Pluteus cervinus]
MKSKNQGLSVPRMLTTAFTLAMVTYSITHLISLADLWLHATSSAIIYNVTTYPKDIHLNYGAVWRESSLECTGSRCHLHGMEDPWEDIVQNGFAIASNASTNISVPWSVNTLRDFEDLAVIVPHTSDPDLRWLAPSIGMRANCSNVTPECLAGVGASPTYNCSMLATRMKQPELSQLPFYSGTSTLDGSSIIENAVLPYGDVVFLQFSWPLVRMALSVSNRFIHFDTSILGARPCAFTMCTISMFNVTLSHTGGGSFTLRPAIMRPSYDSIMADMGPEGFVHVSMDQLANYLLPYAIFETNETNVIASLNQGFSRQFLGLNTYLFQIAPAHNFSLVQPTSIVPRYSLAPVFAYISLILIYSLIALAIFIWASLIPTPVVKAPNGEEMTSLELTQRHLTDPMMIVASILHSQSQTGTPPEPKIGTNPVEMYDEDQHTPRLIVGIEGKSADAGRRFRVRENAGLTSSEG